MVFVWRLLALLAVLAGLVGIIIPGLPTVPFMLVAAWAASKGWPRLEQWLLNHATHGPMIENWRLYGAVPRKAKWLASGMMLASSGIVYLGSWPLWASHGLVFFLLLVCLWLWTRPDTEPTLSTAMTTGHAMPIYAEHTYSTNAEQVWRRIRNFADTSWMPGVKDCRVDGQGVGMIRSIHAVDGSLAVEQLTGLDDERKLFNYRIIEAAGFQEQDHYQATVQVIADPGDSQKCKIEWKADFDSQRFSEEEAERISKMAGKLYRLCLTELAQHIN